jgi:hypothetical protein
MSVSSCGESPSLWSLSFSGKEQREREPDTGNPSVRFGEVGGGASPHLYSISDGGEVGLTVATVTLDSGYGHPNGTDYGSFYYLGNQNGFWSSPLDKDTDHDGLADGHLTINGTEYGEDSYHTNPASADTDGDHLPDYVEIFQLHSSATNPDTDGDWLPDSYEPLPTWDTDNDTLPTIADFDSDNNGTSLTSDYNSTGDGALGNLNMTVVFRTNASRAQYWNPGTWIAVNTTNLPSSHTLAGFVFDANITDLSGYSSLVFQTHQRPDGDTSGTQLWYNWPVKTFEGLAVLANSTHVAIRVNASFAYRFRAWTSGDGAIATGTIPSLHNETSSNYRYRETINWSAMFMGTDDDHDGLTLGQEILNHTNPNLWDTDGDGLGDGSEVRGVFVPAANATFTSNPLVNDTDGDGLGDGFEILGWGGGIASNPNATDTDRDGAWDGNFTVGPEGMPNQTTFNEGEWRNGTNPLKQDTDGDGIPDGWELTYGFNASNPLDSASDPDFDKATNWFEYYWGRNDTNDSWDGFNDTWNESSQGVWWNGTNPLLLDTDNDTMPDGWEMFFDLNPLNASDKNLDPDGDTMLNWQEYNWSIVNASWNQSRSWDPLLSANPRLFDTDGDGMSDYTELETYGGVHRADFDGDGIPSAVDLDSDNDGLNDSVEWHGWDVGVLNADLGRAWAADPRQVNPANASWRHVTSDPFDTDSDNDGVGDAGEFANFSDPHSSDTDGDGLPDSVDYVWSPVRHAYISLSTEQDLERPDLNIAGMGWSIDYHCDGGNLACANITFAIYDNVGVASTKFTNLGIAADAHPYIDPFGFRTESTPDGKWLVGWILVALTGASQFNGQFDVLVEATDVNGNQNQSVFRGGNIHDRYLGYVRNVDVATLEKMRREPDTATCDDAKLLGLTGQTAAIVCISAKANDLGWHYGFDLSYMNSFAGADDWWNGRPDVPKPSTEPCDPHAPWCQKSEINAQHLQELYVWKNSVGSACTYDGSFDFSTLDRWVDFALTIGPSYDPFPPSRYDTVNLTSQAGAYSLYCQVKNDITNASNFAIWLVGFYDGSGSGAWAGRELAIVFVVIIAAGVLILAAEAGEVVVGLVGDFLATGEGIEVAESEMFITGAVVDDASASIGSLAEGLGAVAGESGPLLSQEGGAVLRAAKGAQLLSPGNLPTLRASAGIGAEVDDAAAITQLVGDGTVQRVESLDAIGFNGADPAIEDAAQIETTDLVYAQPTLSAHEVENFVALRQLRGPTFGTKLMGFSAEDRPIMLRLIDYERSDYGDSVAKGRVGEALGRPLFEAQMKASFSDFNPQTDVFVGDLEMRTNQYKDIFLQPNGEYLFPDYAYLRLGPNGYTIRGVGSAKAQWDWSAYSAQLPKIRADTQSLAGAYPNARGFFVTSQENLLAQDNAAVLEPKSQAGLFRGYLRSLANWDYGGFQNYHDTYSYFRPPPGDL